MSPQADIVCLHLRAIVQAGKTALKANVSDMVLPAGVGAAVEVNADRLVPEHLTLQMRHDLSQAPFRLGDRKVAELVAGAGDSALMELRNIPFEPGGVDCRLGFGEALPGDMGEEEVLLVGGANIAPAEAVGDVGCLEELVGGNAPRDDRDANPVGIALFLSAHAQVVLLQPFWFGPLDSRFGCPAQAADQLLPKLLRTPIGDQELEAGVVAATAIPLIPEDLGDGSADIQNMLRLDKDIQVLRKVGLGTQPATDAHMEADLRLAVAKTPHGLDAQVVDLGLVAVDGAPGDGDLIFAGQVGKVFVMEEVVGHFLDDLAGVIEFMRIDPGDRAATDITGDVAASAHGGQPDGL